MKNLSTRIETEVAEGVWLKLYDIVYNITQLDNDHVTYMRMHEIITQVSSQCGNRLENNFYCNRFLKHNTN